SVEDNTIKVQLGEESVVIKKEGDGAYSIEGAEPIMGYVKSAVIRSQECVHCGICPGRCPTGALQLKEDGIEIEEERCVSCRLCLEGPCPAEAYRPSQGFSF
ncbi:MAG: hypothetical protein J7L88_01485, partial [Thermoplasmata archaeon]|nr:hypothetical protein [Thermoplasmata archaeon]